MKKKLELEGTMAAAQSPGGGFFLVMVQNDAWDYGEGQEVRSQEKFEEAVKLINQFGTFMEKKVKLTIEMEDG